jgi:hypothetical protein
MARATQNSKKRTLKKKEAEQKISESSEEEPQTQMEIEMVVAGDSLADLKKTREDALKRMAESSAKQDSSMSQEDEVSTSVTEVAMKKEKKKREKTGIPKMERPKPRRFESGFAVILHGLPEKMAEGVKKNLDEEMKERQEKGDDIYTVELIPLDKIAVVLSPKEEEAFNLLYREKYRNLDRVKLKRLEESSKLEVKLKRKEYNAKKSVKERKKELAKKRREYLREIKNENPERYKQKIRSTISAKQLEDGIKEAAAGQG